MLGYARGFSKSLLIIGLTLAAVNVVPGVEAPDICAHMAFSSVTSMSTDVARSSTRAHCYPNPYRPSSGQTLKFVVYLDQPCDTVAIRVYSLFGHLVWKRENIRCQAGENDGRDNPDLTWNGKTIGNANVANGGYICELSLGNRTEYVKVAVRK